MVRFLIINKNGELLHSNNCFYNVIMGGFGISLVVYKQANSAIKRANKVGGIVVQINQGESVKEKIKETLKNML